MQSFRHFLGFLKTLLKLVTEGINVEVMMDVEEHYVLM